MGAEIFGQIVGIIISLIFIYFNFKIATRFRKNGFISFLIIIPIIGPFIFWIILSRTKIRKQEVN